MNCEITQILEFKSAKANQDVTTLAEQALQQIADKNYAAELHTQNHINLKTAVKLGMSFPRKRESKQK